MSTATPTRGVGSGVGGRRVRHELRDALGVMAFSLTASTGVAVLFRVLLAMAK